MNAIFFERHMDELPASQAGYAWIKSLIKPLGADRMERLEGATPGGVVSAWRGNTLVAYFVLLRDLLNYTVVIGWATSQVEHAPDSSEEMRQLFEHMLELDPFERERANNGLYADACVEESWRGWKVGIADLVAHLQADASTDSEPATASNEEAERTAMNLWWSEKFPIQASGYYLSVRAWLYRATLAPVLPDETQALLEWLKTCEPLAAHVPLATVQMAWMERANRATASARGHIGTLTSVVAQHIADLQRCVAVLSEYPAFGNTLAEVEAAVRELSNVLAPITRRAS